MSDPRLGSPPPGGSRGLNKSTGSGVLLYAIGTGTVRNELRQTRTGVQILVL